MLICESFLVFLESGRMASVTRHGNRAEQGLVELPALPENQLVVDVACTAGSVVAVGSSGMVFAADYAFDSTALGAHHRWRAICQRQGTPFSHVGAGHACAFVH